MRQTGERRAERQKETERQRGSVQQPRPLWEVDVPPYYHSSFLRLARGHSVGGGTRGGQGRGLLPPREGIFCDCCCLLLYCRTYVKAVRGGWSEEEGYGMLRAAACVDESDHHTLMCVCCFVLLEPTWNVV